MNVEPARRHGPFDPRWPRAVRPERHLSLVTEPRSQEEDVPATEATRPEERRPA